MHTCDREPIDRPDAVRDRLLRDWLPLPAHGAIRCGGSGSFRRRIAPTLTFVLVTTSLAGCSGFGFGNDAARSIELSSFSKPAQEGAILGRSPVEALRGAPRGSVVESDLGGGDPASSLPTLIPQAGDADSSARTAAASTKAEESRPRPTAPQANEEGVEPTELVSETWRVDALVGQINGRPIFADEFFASFEEALIRIARSSEPMTAAQQMRALIHERFEAWVSSELIISEAESNLTPEQQQGFFGWLKTLQEGTIAEYAGSREEAREAMQEELGMDIDEFMDQRRDAALARYLLDRKVKPRTIVAWRDIEREYARRFAEFNPPALASIGRIALDPTRDAAKIEQVKAMLSEGKSFRDIAEAMKLERGGVALQVPIKSGQSVDEAIRSSADLIPAVKESLASVPVGSVAEPIRLGSSLNWLSVVGVEQKPGRSLFDPDVQLQLRAELDAERSAIERARYIGGLRSRWISDDIKRIEDRLFEIALTRYLR